MRVVLEREVLLGNIFIVAAVSNSKLLKMASLCCIIVVLFSVHD